MTDTLDGGVQAERARVLAMDHAREIAPADAAHTLVVRSLHKCFPPKAPGAPTTRAVRDCSFRVANGELFGLLGANGAGKSTTFNMIIRYLSPSAGNIWVKGKSVLDEFPKVCSEPARRVLQGHEC